MQTAVFKKTYILAFIFVMVSMLLLFTGTDYASASVLKQKVDSVGDGIWQFLKDIGKIVMTVTIATMGYSVLWAKSAEGLADMKGRVATVLICFFLVFGAEWIVDFFMGFFK